MPILFGRYELGAPLGSGATATVYRARDTVENRDVALKIVTAGPDLHPIRQRFLAEARALARLRSRRIAALYDHGMDQTGGLYLALELVPEPLALEPKSFGRPLLPHEVLRVARALFEGIADAHDAGVLHLDLKPRNILVPGGSAYGFESPKIVDFGIAAPARDGMPSDSPPAATALWGTADYMPPEAFTRGAVSAQSDIYSAGLVLFELLGVGLLHSGATRDERLRARITKAPNFAGRVPEPLATALTRMLAKDERDRFRSAREAFEYIADLDTAPVNSRGPMSEPPRQTMPPPPSAVASLSPETLASEDLEPTSIRPSPVISPRPAPFEDRPNQDDVPSIPAPPPTPTPVFSPPPARLYEIDDTPEKALSQVLAMLDMVMLDAISRRERSSAFGRILRALALALRLDLDAAALLLEPLAAQHAVGAMVGVTMLAPRARRVTRARVDSARSDEWAQRVEPELAARAAVMAIAIGAREEAERSAERIERIRARIVGEQKTQPYFVNLEVADLVAAFTLGQKEAGHALEELDDVVAGTLPPNLPFDECTRALFVAILAARVDPDRAARELRRALGIATRASCTLLEVRTLSLLGALLIESEGQAEEGQRLLSRAAILLGHGDAPSLLHATEQSRGALLILRGDHRGAAERFKVARGAARAEVALDLEGTSTVNEIVARVGAGQRNEAKELVQELVDSKLAMMLPRTQAFAFVARGLVALAMGDYDLATRETSRAKERVHAARIETSDIAFARSAIEALAQAAKNAQFDETAALAELESLSVARGYVGLYWLDILSGAVRGAAVRDNGRLAGFVGKMRERLVPHRERRTSPPGA